MPLFLALVCLWITACLRLSPEQRTLRASIAAHVMHAKHDSREITANARARFLGKFLAQVDAVTPGLPEAERLRRAEHLLRAHMKRLALASSRARRKAAAT
jgi:hydroxymethylpyrimidine/phosphomethylpyrimidine kinase